MRPGPYQIAKMISPARTPRAADRRRNHRRFREDPDPRVRRAYWLVVELDRVCAYEQAELSLEVYRKGAHLWRRHLGFLPAGQRVRYVHAISPTLGGNERPLLRPMS